MLLSLAASTAAPEPDRRCTSSAAPPADVMPLSQPLEGPLRFSEERSWLRALQENAGGRPTAIGGRMFVTSGGRYYVPTPS